MSEAIKTNQGEKKAAENRPTYDLMEELDLLDPGAVRFFIDAFDELCLEFADGTRHGPLSLRRAFPVSATGDFIALRADKGDELGIVRRLAELDEGSRGAVERELERTYFAPKITAVHSIVTKNHIPRWEVETDRGPCVFELHSSRRDLRVLAKMTRSPPADSSSPPPLSRKG